MHRTKVSSYMTLDVIILLRCGVCCFRAPSQGNCIDQQSHFVVQRSHTYMYVSAHRAGRACIIGVSEVDICTRQRRKKNEYVSSINDRMNLE